MSSETPDRLKAAVEELLLNQGEAGITLREITDSAGANVAAVAYHFRSKDALIALVFGQAIDEVTALQTKRVLALPKDHTLRELIEVWLHPLLSHGGPDNREAKLWRMIQRGAAEKAPGLLTNMTRAENPVEQTLIPLLGKHLPHLGTEELLFRHNAILGGLAGLVSSPIGISMSTDSIESRFQNYIIAWIIGSLEGPASNQN